MKTKHLFFLSALILFFAACSDDNDSGTATPDNPTSNYFPLSVGNQWTYNNVVEAQDQDPQQSTETLTVSDSTEANGTVNYEFTSDASPENQGLITGTFTTGNLTKVDGKLIYNGSFEFDFPNLNTPISIPLTNLIVFDQNKDSGQNLITVNNSITQDIELGADGTMVPVTFDYSLKSDEGDVFENYSAGEQQFNDVISSDLTFNLSATAEVFGFSVQILVDQQVLTSTNYFAKDVGMIYSTNTIHVEFEDLSEYNLPQLDPVNTASSQTIVDYSLQ